MDKKNIYIFCGQWYIPEFEKIIKSANRWANGYLCIDPVERPRNYGSNKTTSEVICH